MRVCPSVSFVLEVDNVVYTTMFFLSPVDDCMAVWIGRSHKISLG